MKIFCQKASWLKNFYSCMAWAVDDIKNCCTVVILCTCFIIGRKCTLAWHFTPLCWNACKDLKLFFVLVHENVF